MIKEKNIHKEIIRMKENIQKTKNNSEEINPECKINDNLNTTDVNYNHIPNNQIFIKQGNHILQNILFMRINIQDKIKDEAIKKDIHRLMIEETNIKEAGAEIKVIKKDKLIEDKRIILMILIKKTIKVKIVTDIKEKENKIIHILQKETIIEKFNIDNQDIEIMIILPIKIIDPFRINMFLEILIQERVIINLEIIKNQIVHQEESRAISVK